MLKNDEFRRQLGHDLIRAELEAHGGFSAARRDELPAPGCGRRSAPGVPSDEPAASRATSRPNWAVYEDWPIPF